MVVIKIKIKKLYCLCTGSNQVLLGSLPQVTVAAMSAGIFKGPSAKAPRSVGPSGGGSGLL